MKKNSSDERGSVPVIIGVIILAIVVFGISYWTYFKYYRLAYTDKTYNFSLMNRRGWHELPKEEGVYYSLGTSDVPGGKVVSTFRISPITRKDDTSITDSSSFQKICSDLIKEINYTILGWFDVRYSGLEGHVCKSEGKAADIDRINIFSIYLLMNPGGTYDYMIFTTYPKGNLVEEAKVNEMLRYFHAD
ncbi:hypothetical protein A2V56_04775 [Candidatus Woesebacteria bacterium RBG_19FT_COMBO_42_9]|uniref:PsbP C-terminal domain-containing protein n=1 Tax=Candidatus Woesebacteria bacterium RBG_16_42_24 TaxID=1802485 RepID=A0A1F7XLN1_9BACT|nr:MAG: hypothetical protein A2V97_04010 [Candidatus Woesebacteria bacterium RBG_16_42_24]OGM17712.1 MAG: hypothetical protein A2V56_04775 [Candidatus Woesebacteria bacterium RBG_19FT_COMBO_42_9]OGM66546.1 MAG: hypothetical protein A2985_03075 [Candidatus Woesebacteria bacterium RIFCSPLOWO2_01_FULL_43_11]